MFGQQPHMPIDGMKVSHSFWQDVLSCSSFGIGMLLLLGFLILLVIYIPQTYQISRWLTLAEHEMKRLNGTKNGEMTALLLHRLYEG